MKCLDCKYWKPNGGKVQADMGECEKINADSGNFPNIPDAVVVSWCCCGSAKTGKDFGCVKFEQKPE